MSLELIKWKVKEKKERCALEKIYSHTFAAYINLKSVTSRFKDRIEQRIPVLILWMIGGNINFVGFTVEEEEDLSLWAFGRLGVAVKFLRMLTPPLSLIVVLFLSLSC